MNKNFLRRAFSVPRIPEGAREIIAEVALLLCALALAPVKFFFSTYPFGLALSCACTKSTPFAVLGCAIGALLFMENPLPYLITLLAIVALRLVGSVWLHDNGKRSIALGKATRPSFINGIFSEKSSVRVAISAICTLGLSVYRVIVNGFSYYDIFVLVFLVVFVSILTYALCSVLSTDESDGRGIGICALLFIAIFAIRGKELFSLDVSIILSYGAVLYASRHYNGGRSAMLGAVLGICHGVSFAPVFAIGGLVSSVLWSLSYYIAIIGALVLSVGYGILATGYEALVYLLPELLFASLIMYPLTRFGVLPKIKLSSADQDERGGLLEYYKASVQEGLEGVRSSLMELSATLSELGTRAKAPDREGYKDACLEIVEEYCYSCPKRAICWERDTVTTKENIARLSEEAYLSSTVSVKVVEEKFLHRCPNIEKIVADIEDFKRKEPDPSQRSEGLESSAQGYELSSKLISELNSRLDSALSPDASLSERVCEVLRSVGLKFKDAFATSKGDYQIIATGVDTEGSSCTLDELKDALESELGFWLNEPDLKELGEEKILYIKFGASVNIDYFKDKLSQNDKEANGDSLCAFFAPNNKFYMLLCDGMGTGKDAHMTSSLCTELLQKTLCSLGNKEMCLSILNSLLRAKGKECSSSVDLLEIDLVSAEACLTKSGAAPSFIKRGESVFRLHSKTAPIGIMKGLYAERLDFSLKDGDIVVVISDGIASDERDSRYLVDFLSKLEIIPDDEPFIDTDTAKSPREVVAPANLGSRAGADAFKENESLYRDVLFDTTPPKRLPLSALPSAIISLASSRPHHRDDMSVGIARITTKRDENNL